MKLLAFLLRRSPGWAGGAITVGALGGVGGAALMAVINQQLQRVASGGEGAPPEGAGGSGWLFAAVVVLILLAGYGSRALMGKLSERISYDLRMSLCRQIVASPLAVLERVGNGPLLAAMTQDVQQLTAALVNLPTLCINLSVVVGCLVFMAWLSTPLLGVLIGFLLVAVGSVKLPERRALRALQQARQAWDHLAGHFQALTQGVKQLQLHAPRRRVFFDVDLAESADAYRRFSFQSLHVYAATNSWSQVLYFVFIGLLLYGAEVLPAFSAADLVGYTLTSLYMRGPLVQLLDMMPMFGRANVALQKIERLGWSLPQVSNGAARGTWNGRLAPRAEIKLSGVELAYRGEGEDGAFHLGPIDLELAPGELVFLVGGNGSGKTTLAKLLTGLYTPEKGEIRLGSTAVTPQNQEWYRQHFSVVFSDFHLFGDLFGLNEERPGADQRARGYLELLHLQHKVSITGGRLSTTDLSQGQRKRLALLVAYLEDRPVYVFDEWAADQDPEFKRVFYLELLPELKARGKAVLAITHDDRFFSVADRVLKLEDGRFPAETGQ
ncbi:MAG TPA: cyclic peptide export ABC transporter [Thermoanaerobaculia bacterium]|nr:cyclic peptide export ABC transporter [Thermoanaerobaculia bacterium]